MRKLKVTVTISEQDKPEKQIIASLDNVPEDRLMSSLVDLASNLALYGQGQSSLLNWAYGEVEEEK